jgi:hypothetical protein
MGTTKRSCKTLYQKLPVLPENVLSSKSNPDTSVHHGGLPTDGATEHGLLGTLTENEFHNIYVLVIIDTFTRMTGLYQVPATDGPYSARSRYTSLATLDALRKS